MINKEQKLLGGGGYLKINNNSLSYQDSNPSSCIKDSIICNITNNTNNKAFSLIELSIVLIIMGLLVAGIMGGSSLIQA